MRKMFSALLCVGLLAGFSGVALATTQVIGVQHVYVNVNPTVSLGPLAGTFNGQSIQPGHETATLEVGWIVHSNSQKVALNAGASYLFKGDVPCTGDETNFCYRIPTIDSVNIRCEFASPMANYPTLTPYGAGTTIVVEGYTVLMSKTVYFESRQNNAFSQNCWTTFKWATTDSELPVGEYSGVVRLVVTVLPSTTTGQGYTL